MSLKTVTNNNLISEVLSAVKGSEDGTSRLGLLGFWSLCNV